MAEELTIVRVFDAPVERVWRAWTDPEQIKRWWGPQYFDSPASEIDLRVGGKYLLAMRSPQGQTFWSTGVYEKIVPLHEIEYTDRFADEHGNVVPASYYGLSESFPSDTRVMLRFEELPDHKTRLTMRQVGLPTGEELENTRLGWNQSFDKLAESLQAPKEKHVG